MRHAGSPVSGALEKALDMVSGGTRGEYFVRYWTEERLARIIWEADPIPCDPSVTWDTLVPGEYGHAKAFKIAAALRKSLRLDKS